MQFPMSWNKKWSSELKYFCTSWLLNMCLFKCITGILSENPLAVNGLTSLKNLITEKKITFILLFHYSKTNWVWKMLFLIRSEILRLLVNTLTANCEYSRSNRENLLLPIQINLSKKPSTFCDIFLAFLVFTCNFKYCETKNKRQRSSVSQLIDSKRCAYLIA